MDTFSQPDESSQDACLTQMMDIMTQDCQLTPSSQSNLTPTSDIVEHWGRLMSGDGSSEAQPLVESAYLLGRSKQSCIKLSTKFPSKDTKFFQWSFTMISNRHCEIHKLDDCVLIKDTSHNGVFVNGKKVTGSQLLKTGDEICLLSRAILSKKIRSASLLKQLLLRFSFVFIPNKQLPNTDYELLEVLGRGTVGEVRRAIHVATNQHYAVKTIPFTLYSESEVSILKQLDHPYIVRLIDVYKTDKLNLVMEYVSGGDLYNSIVERGQYSEVDARKVIRRLLSVLYYLHNTLNVLHRDLKPENILVGDTIKVTDFGVARFDTAATKTFCGTPQYFAPELLNRNSYGRSVYGKPADLWSVGMITYVLLTGCNYEAGNYGGVPDSARDFIEHLLDSDPKKRLTVLQACDHPWILTQDCDTHCHPLDDPLLLDVHRKGYVPSAAAAKATATVSNNDKPAAATNDADSKTSSAPEPLPVENNDKESKMESDPDKSPKTIDDAPTNPSSAPCEPAIEATTLASSEGSPVADNSPDSFPKQELRKISASPERPNKGERAKNDTDSNNSTTCSERRFSPASLANDGTKKRLERSDSTPQTCNKKPTAGSPRCPLSPVNGNDERPQADITGTLFDPKKLLHKEADSPQSKPAEPSTKTSTEDDILSQFSEQTESIDSFSSMIPIVEAEQEPKQQESSTAKPKKRTKKSTIEGSKSSKKRSNSTKSSTKAKAKKTKTEDDKKEKGGKQTTIESWFAKKK